MFYCRPATAAGHLGRIRVGIGVQTEAGAGAAANLLGERLQSAIVMQIWRREIAANTMDTHSIESDKRLASPGQASGPNRNSKIPIPNPIDAKHSNMKLWLP